MAGKMLPDKLVERLDRENKTDMQIVQHLAEHENVHVTRQAISAWRRRRGLARRQVQPKAVPWKLRPEHVHSALAKAIRIHGMVQQGLTINDDDRARYERVMERLAQDDVVIHYDADTEQGWFLVPRRPGVDDGIVREPGPLSG